MTELDSLISENKKLRSQFIQVFKEYADIRSSKPTQQEVYEAILRMHKHEYMDVNA